MPIVRSDRRNQAIADLREMRLQLRGLLTQADALQATCEAVELDLGLANEGEQATRDQLMVLHYRKGDEVGHPLDDCDEHCAKAEALIETGEGGDDEKEEAGG